jgi:hypothetical protein
MNNQSEQAKIRSRLFEPLLQRYGAIQIPGRYVGDFDNYQLGFAVEKGTDLFEWLLCHYIPK